MDELDAFIVSCIAASANQKDCDKVRGASPACLGCMVGPDSTRSWGPIVVSSLTPFEYGNFAGCLALLTGDQSSNGCGALQQAARVCTEMACTGPSCPALTPYELDRIAQCVTDATGSVCASYQTAELACVADLVNAGGPSADAVRYCSQATYGDEGAFYRALGVVFCVSPPGGVLRDGGANDAGAVDAGDGGGTD
jgi:hypothetical protein